MSSMFLILGRYFWRTLVIGTLAYGALVALLYFRQAHADSASTLFDLVTHRRFGSTLATVWFSKT